MTLLFPTDSGGGDVWEHASQPGHGGVSQLYRGQSQVKRLQRVSRICPIFIGHLTPRTCGSNLKSMNYKLILQNSNLNAHCGIALRWMLPNLTNEKLTLVQVMAWCCQATSHFLNQCWPSSVWLSGVMWPQWVKASLWAIGANNKSSASERDNW